MLINFLQFSIVYIFSQILIIPNILILNQQEYLQ